MFAVRLESVCAGWRKERRVEKMAEDRDLSLYRLDLDKPNTND